jgi:hypothetical protein
VQNFIRTILNAVRTWTKTEIKKNVSEVDTRINTSINTRIDNSKADWNQNDPSADSYIENRTHYEGKGYLVEAFHFDTPQKYVECWLSLVEGQTYLVIYNGIEYIVECTSRGGFDSVDGATLPFEWHDTSDGCWLESFNEDLIDFEVYEHMVKQIDLKYIPDEIIQVIDEVQVAKDAAEAAQTTAGTKMDSVNPTGSGTVSIGRTRNSKIGSNSVAIGTDVSALHEYETVFGRNNYTNSVTYMYDYVITSTRPSRASGTTVYGSNSFTFDSNTGLFTLVDPELYTLSTSRSSLKYFCTSSEDLNNLTSLFVWPDNAGWFNYSGRYYVYLDQIARVAQTSARDKLLVVGNGYFNTSATNSDSSSNAHTLDWDGNAWYAGDVYVGSSSGKYQDSGSKKLATEELVLSPKKYFVMVDDITSYEYVICMEDGVLTSSCRAISIEVTTMPIKTEYMNGDWFDPTGMIVTAICQDGTTKTVKKYTCTHNIFDGKDIEIAYEECGIIYSTTVDINNFTIVPFDPALRLVDFDYTENNDGTYTITGWKQTLNGEPSTEMIVPDNNLIIL